MARKKENADPLTLAIIYFMLIAGVIMAIFTWVKEHIVIVVIVILLIAFFAALPTIIDELEWSMFLNRANALDAIGNQEFLIESLTQMGLAGEKREVYGCDYPVYNRLYNSIHSAYSSEGIWWVVKLCTKDFFSDNFDGKSLLKRINVIPDDDVVDFYCQTAKTGGYHIVILPDSVYIFVTHKSKCTFVGAYNVGILSVETSFLNDRREYHNISDMSHRNRVYFLQYCDIHDADVESCGWKYETANGYRDGRRQGNNYFIVKYKYAKVDFKIGNVISEMAFSKTDTTYELENCLEEFANNFEEFACD